ncbi:MAG: (2Fe-2S) ferredoxin domain-containing protein [Clostridia bacterium]
MPRPVAEAQYRILVCQGTSCRQRGGVDAHHEWLLAGHTRPWVVVPSACLRFCVHAPVTVVYPDGVWLPRLTAERVRDAVQRLENGTADAIAGAIPAFGPRADASE